MLDWSEIVVEIPVELVLAPPPPREDSDVTGLGKIARGAARVRVDDKAMINCRADVNQLLPLKYRWAWEVSLRLQQPLDADRNLHAGGHRTLENSRGSHRGRAPGDQAKSRLLCRFGVSGGQQYRSGNLPPPDQVSSLI
jgi:hypothetical protein